MACSKCKKKEMMNLIEKESSKMEKWALLTLLVVVASAIYGIYSLIVKLL